MSGLGTEGRRVRWEAAGELPLAAATLAFLAAYAWPILDQDLSTTGTRLCQWTVWATWAILVADFLVRFALSKDRGRFVLSTPLEIATIALPLLRPLRLLRLLTLLGAVNRHAGKTLRGRVGIYVAGSVALVVFVASLAVLDAERDGGNIDDFGDAVWWSMTTISTIGYGDLYPVTGTGRLVAVGLMLAGIALLGIVTASVATWLIERVAQTDADLSAATRRDIATVREELAELKALLLQARTEQEPREPRG
jgi:voltage-gated potassium channel